MILIKRIKKANQPQDCIFKEKNKTDDLLFLPIREKIEKEIDLMGGYIYGWQ